MTIVDLLADLFLLLRFKCFKPEPMLLNAVLSAQDRDSTYTLQSGSGSWFTEIPDRTEPRRPYGRITCSVHLVIGYSTKILITFACLDAHHAFESLISFVRLQPP